jgi:hypothetical protein
MEQANLKPNNSKGKLYDLLERYADKWLSEVIKILKQLTTVIIIGVVIYVIFWLGLLVIVVYLLIHYLR